MIFRKKRDQETRDLIRQEIKLHEWEKLLTSIETGMHVKYDDLIYKVVKIFEYIQTTSLYLEIGDQNIVVRFDHCEPRTDLKIVKEKGE